jgi:UDP-N-acetyl-D-galactosamine dehydrogenase
MSLYEKIVAREEKISLVGLGYVGMPIAVAFAKKVDVIGYDLNKKKIETCTDNKTKTPREIVKN